MQKYAALPFVCPMTVQFVNMLLTAALLKEFPLETLITADCYDLRRKMSKDIGVTEALDSEGDEFGMANVIKAIQASASEGAAGIITRLTDDLRAFVGAYPQHDDITLIVICKK